MRRLSTHAKTLVRARNALLHALEGARHTAASANIAYLERDPVERPPRQQFNVEASESAAVLLAAALRDARAVVQAGEEGDRRGEGKAEQGTEDGRIDGVQELEELAKLVRQGETRLDQVFGEIRQARSGLKGI